MYTSLLLTIMLRITFGEMKICSNIKKSQNILKMIVDLVHRGRSAEICDSLICFQAFCFYKDPVIKLYMKMNIKILLASDCWHELILTIYCTLLCLAILNCMSQPDIINSDLLHGISNCESFSRYKTRCTKSMKVLPLIAMIIQTKQTFYVFLYM